VRVLSHPAWHRGTTREAEDVTLSGDRDRYRKMLATATGRSRSCCSTCLWSEDPRWREAK
jgi:hypothetical protein